MGFHVNLNYVIPLSNILYVQLIYPLIKCAMKKFNKNIASMCPSVQYTNNHFIIKSCLILTLSFINSL